MPSTNNQKINGHVVLICAEDVNYLQKHFFQVFSNHIRKTVEVE